MFCGGLFAGRIFDSHGPRWLLAGGSSLFISCFFIIPECKEYWQFFLAQGVVFGISISTMYQPSLFILNIVSSPRSLASAIGSDENELWLWGLCIQVPLLVEWFGRY